MEITFDLAKDKRNIQKHGISLQRTEDFDIGAALYDVDDSQDYGEVRYLAIGWLDGLLHMLTFTQDGESIHAISLRKATRQEREDYEQSQ